MPIRLDSIEFHSTEVNPTDEGWHVRGTLALHGRERDVEFDASRREDRVHVEVEFDHTEFDIEPYSAMLNSLEVSPEVVVTVQIPRPDEG